VKTEQKKKRKKRKRRNAFLPCELSWASRVVGSVAFFGDALNSGARGAPAHIFSDRATKTVPNGGETQ